MKIVILSAFVAVFALLTFPTLSAASVIKPASLPEHVFEDKNVDFGMRTGLAGAVKVINNRAILLQKSGLTKNEVLVITTNKDGLSPQMIKALTNGEAHVEGRAQVLSVQKLEDRTGVNLDNTAFKKYEGKTIVVAETIDLK